MKSVADVADRPIAELVSLRGRVAVVTGGGRGLGKAIVQRLCEAGASVLIGDIDDELASKAAADIGRRYGKAVLGTFMDVAQTTSVTAAADLAAKTFGAIDIWVNNAGIFPSVRISEMTDELWDKVLDINVRGVFVGAREAAQRMTAAGRGGVIVNIVSTAGFKGIAPGLAAYVSSKHAVRGLTKQMALELAPEGDPRPRRRAYLLRH